MTEFEEKYLQMEKDEKRRENERTEAMHEFKKACLEEFCVLYKWLNRHPIVIVLYGITFFLVVLGSILGKI